MLRRFPSLVVALLLCSGRAAAQSPVPDSSLAARYRPIANRIIAQALSDSSAYARMAYLTDTFGPRLSGSENLERALDWLEAEMRRDGFDRVAAEPVMVPHWVRGEESITLLEPRETPMAMLGLGGSVGTPPEGITAEVLVVRSFEELERRRQEAAGRIVLFNVPFTTYGETVEYRARGAARAAKAGAVAALVRSVASASLYTPHTGTLSYEANVPPIPGAAITVEDAAMLQRMQDRGQRPRVRLYMEARTLPDAPSRNLVAEIRGTELPDEIVVLGGHIDSWDVGTGAVDDAGGCVVSWEVLRLIRELGLRPRRTLRVVFWANEENGLRGGTAYRKAHDSEVDNHVLAIETDEGVFKPTGFGFSGDPAAMAVVRQIGRLLEPIGAGSITPGGGGADISPLMRQGVPGMSLNVDPTRYFWYHHSHADTADKLDPHEMNLSAAAMAVMAFVVADLPERLPRAAPASTH